MAWSLSPCTDPGLSNSLQTRSGKIGLKDRKSMQDSKLRMKAFPLMSGQDSPLKHRRAAFVTNLHRVKGFR